tara:strand:- start:594 stop:1226 length:633 start_codon:yes stop_codon:yes gene_type:complete
MYKLSNFKQDTIFTYYLTDCKKIIKHKVLTPDEVNTGSSNINTGHITIWRWEEVYKTTLHELIHRMNIDGFHENMLQVYKNRYGIISKNITINESITDFWAILINVYLISKLLDESYKYFVMLINIEKIYIIHQAQKILSLNKDWNRYTNVLSYYVIKAELYQNIPLTLKAMNYKINDYSNVKNILMKAKPIIPKYVNDISLKMSIINIQ